MARRACNPYEGLKLVDMARLTLTSLARRAYNPYEGLKPIRLELSKW